MTNAIKVLLQMTSVSLQPVPSLCILMKEFPILSEIHMPLHITIVRLTVFGVLKRFC
jgi:hypothetical protein